MTDEVKLTVDTLRYCEESGARCGECPSGVNENGVPNCHSQACIADLIESLAAELEQVKRERDELVTKCHRLEARNDTLIAKEVLFDEAIAAGAKMQRERDAAVEGMAGICRKHNVCDGCKNDDAAYIPNDCIDCANACNWQWRGMKED